jgi:DNA-binding NtrC family response regulator
MDRARWQSMAQFARPGPATILIVENEVLVRLELAHHLGQAGLVVLEANDADEAIAILDAHTEIELMITDIMMPGSIDGIRLAHHVRDRWPPLKIIVASGRLQTSLSELPADSLFIAKPFQHEAMDRAVADMLSNNRLRPAA